MTEMTETIEARNANPLPLPAKEDRAAILMYSKDGSWGWRLARMPAKALAAIADGNRIDSGKVIMETPFVPCNGVAGADLEAARIGGLLGISVLRYYTITAQTKFFAHLSPPKSTSPLAGDGDGDGDGDDDTGEDE